MARARHRQLLDDGVGVILEAAEKDKEGELHQALELYVEGLQLLMTGAMYERQESVKRAATERIHFYMSRAEEIKRNLDEISGGGDDKDKKKETESDERKAEGAGGGDDDRVCKRIVQVKHASVDLDKDVIGLGEAKATLKERLILPLRFPDLFAGKRRPKRHVLLYGPPGTGKSLLVEACATAVGCAVGDDDCALLKLSCSDLICNCTTSEAIEAVGYLYAKADDCKPCLVQLDEIDSLCSERGDDEPSAVREVLVTLLTAMNNIGADAEVGTRVMSIATTNCPWNLDPMTRRHFDKRVYVPLPGVEERRDILKLQVESAGVAHVVSDADLQSLAEQTGAFSGADLAQLVYSAKMEPVRDMQEATHFKQVMDGHEAVIVACAGDEPGARKMTLLEIPEEEQARVRCAAMSMAHMARVLELSKPAFEIDVEPYEKWRDAFGDA